MATSEDINLAIDTAGWVMPRQSLATPFVSSFKPWP